jgi:hypothetical protein
MTYTIRHTEKVTSALLVLLAIFVFVETADYPTGPSAEPGPAFFPRIIAALLAGLGVVLFVNNVRDGGGRTFELSRPVTKRVLVATAFPIVYMFVMSVLGFLVSTVLFLATFMYYSGARSYPAIAGSSVGVTLLLYYVFAAAFRVALPEGIVPVSRLLPDLPLLIGGVM